MHEAEQHSFCSGLLVVTDLILLSDQVEKLLTLRPRSAVVDVELISARMMQGYSDNIGHAKHNDGCRLDIQC